MNLTFRIYPLIFLIVVSSLISCGGGGSSDSGGSSSGGRTSKTGLRVVHASLDSVPVGVFQDGVFLTSASYMESKDYVPVVESSSILKISRGARPSDLFRQLNFQPVKNTEYTLLVLGELGENDLDVELISEPIARPAKGLGRIRFLNALDGARNATCSVSDGVNSVSLSSAYGVVSETLEVGNGIKNITVVPSSGDRKAGTFELPDRGEWLIVLAGKNELGFSTFKVISDLD